MQRLSSKEGLVNAYLDEFHLAVILVSTIYGEIVSKVFFSLLIETNHKLEGFILEIPSFEDMLVDKHYWLVRRKVPSH